jgi:isoleucyl-tRNA synthetase
VDSARWYFYTINQPGDAKLFAEKDIDGVLKRFIFTLWNCYLFWETYGEKTRAKLTEKNLTLLDKWIISKLNKLIEDEADLLDKYDVTGAARIIEKFSIEDLSLWYIRRSRRRFQKPETKIEAKTASAVLGFVLLSLSKLTAPFIPFVSEEIYQRVNDSKFKKLKSVHLEGWAEVVEKSINEKLNKDMEKVREIVALALAERAKAKIKVRQPLGELKIKAGEIAKQKDLLDLIKEEINVKKIIYDDKINGNVELNTEITPELKEEGVLREIVRNIQEMRKKSNLKPKDKISVIYSGDPYLEGILKKNEQAVLKEGKIKNLQAGKAIKTFNIQQEINVDGKKILLAIKKIK